MTEEKLVRNMSYDGHMLLSSRLGPSCASGKNYKPLASMLGYTYEEVLDLERKEDPVMYLLKDRRFIDLTISRLKSCLLDMERLDVVEDLEPFEGDTDCLTNSFVIFVQALNICKSVNTIDTNRYELID